MKTKIGLFPRDRDSIMSTEADSYEFCYLVAKNTAESEWAHKFLPEAKTLEFDIQSIKKNYSCVELSEILRYSDIVNVLKKNKIYNLYVDIATEELDLWANDNNINLIVTPFKFRKIYEDKIYFDEILQKNTLSKPESKIVEFQKGINNLPYEGINVVQDPYSAGGEGTYFVDKEDSLDSLVSKTDLKYDQKYLVRKFVTGKTYGITVFIASGMIVLSSIRSQCFDKSVYRGRNIFLGIQWIPRKDISDNLVKKIEEQFHQVGQILYKQNFFGFANFDFIVDEVEDLFIIECNARFSNATVQQLKFKELSGGIDISEIFINQSIHKQAYKQSFDLSGYPDTNFEGSTIKLNLYPELKNEKFTIQKVFPPGIYNVTDGIKFIDSDIRKFSDHPEMFMYYSDVQFGEVYTKFAEIGRIVTNYRLYDNSGTINQSGENLINYFNYLN